MFIFLGSTVVGAVEFEFRDVYAGVGLGVRLQNCSQGLRLLCGFRASGLDGLVLLYYHPAKPLNDVSLVTEIGKAWTLKHYTVLLYSRLSESRYSYFLLLATRDFVAICLELCTHRCRTRKPDLHREP